MENFYQSLGYLILGSRLRRLSEYYLSKINRVYQQEGIEFDASWFPVFYLLSQHQPINILELSETMQVSHSAASQLITVLKKQGLVKAIQNSKDKRKQEISLTPTGEKLLKVLIPIWETINSCITNRIENDPASKGFLLALNSVEQHLQSISISEEIISHLKPIDKNI